MTAVTNARTRQHARSERERPQQQLRQTATTLSTLARTKVRPQALAQPEATKQTKLGEQIRARTLAKTGVRALPSVESARHARAAKSGQARSAPRQTRAVVGPSTRARPVARLYTCLPPEVRTADRATPRAVRRVMLLWLPVLTCALLGADLLVRNRSLLRADLLDRRERLLPAVLGLLVAAGWATLLATSTDRRGRRPAAALRWSALAAGPLSTLPLLFLAGHGTAVASADTHLDRWGLPCFFLAYLIAAPSLVLLARELRRRFSVFSTWRSTALASVAGSWSALTLLLHCPGVQLEHLLVGHVLPIFLLPAIGLWLARRCLRIF